MEQLLRDRIRSGELTIGARMTHRTPSPRRDVREAAAGGGRTRDELYEEAKALGIPGRSKMTKEELQKVVDQKRGRRAS